VNTGKSPIAVIFPAGTILSRHNIMLITMGTGKLLVEVKPEGARSKL